MNLHLFSVPGKFPLTNIVIAGRPYLIAQSKPVVLYIPAAEINFQNEYVEITKEAFKNIASVETLDLTQKINQEDFDVILNRASVIYIPGGNTFLLLHRLFESGLFKLLQKRLLAGIPLVAYSAGSLICGKDILTSGDINCCGTNYYEGFNFVPINFIVHYNSENISEVSTLKLQLDQYHSFFDNSVIALEDDAYIKVDDSGMRLIRGKCWLFKKDKKVEQLLPGFIEI